MIEAACASHGGLDTWRNVHRFQGTFRTLGGPIPVLKGLGTTFNMPTAFSVYPQQRTTVFHNYPKVEQEIAWDGGTSPARLLVSSPDAGQTELANYRQRFHGLAKWRRWNATDAAYFFGYALLTYFSVPFILQDCEVLRGNSNSITVRFPSNLESHCPIQTFWFNRHGLITRHDYVADILGKIFHGAHYSTNFMAVQGVSLAQTRRVVPRLGFLPFPLVVLYAALAFETSSATATNDEQAEFAAKRG